jgi:hypothetical protein
MSLHDMKVTENAQDLLWNRTGKTMREVLESVEAIASIPKKVSIQAV